MLSENRKSANESTSNPIQYILSQLSHVCQWPLTEYPCFSEGKTYFPPRLEGIDVKYDSTYVSAGFNEWHGWRVSYYDAIADIWYKADGTWLRMHDPIEEILADVAFKWDIKTLEQLLKRRTVIRKGAYSKFVRLVRKDNKIKQWDEYIFHPIEYWEVSKLLQEMDSSD